MSHRSGGVRASLLIVICIAVVCAPEAPSLAASPYEMSDPVSFVVKTEHGSIYVESIHPLRDGALFPAPSILTYSPYSALGRNSDADDWVPRGYARVWADVIGTGDSGGCWDYGGKREQQTGYDLVEWIAKQKWSNGKVAMMGGAYDGTTAVATAITRPPHLTTIVPESAIARWYDYAYSGGIRYSLNNEFLGHQGPPAATQQAFDTPALFDFGLAIPPPLDVGDPSWAERVQSTIEPCAELEHTQRGYDDTPDYDAFWRERDYEASAGRIDIPVLLGANWGDWNVKQVESWDLFRALDKSPKTVLYMGNRWTGHERPGGAYPEIVERWLDHYLRGAQSGIERLPSVISQTSDSDGPRDFDQGVPKTTDVVLYAQLVPPVGGYAWRLLPAKPRVLPGFTESIVATFNSASINTESHALHHARLNHDWFWFEAPPFKRNVRVFGEIKVQVWLDVERRWVTVTPTVADVDMSDHLIVGAQHVGATDPAALVGLTRGWLDSRYRDGLEKQVPIPAGGSFGMTIRTKPTDYIFKAGHFVGLSIQTEINEWSIPKPYPCRSATCTQIKIDLKQAKTRLILPVVEPPANPAALFDVGHQQHSEK